MNRITPSLFAIGLAFTSLAATSLPAYADAGFRKWVRGFEGVASRNGIKRSVYRAAFKGVSAPDPEVIQLTRFQPEFKQQMWQYFDSRVNEESISRGREMNRTWDGTLSRLERKYGVSRYILLAIWSMETSYGKALEKDKSTRNVIRSLSTLAYKDRRRRKFARSQLIGALKMVQRGYVRASNLQGSWAGAMGHTQFIPTSYLAFRQDGDGNGTADIWTSVPDALATAANLLKRNGWRTGQTWGYEVTVPASLRRQAGKTRTVGEWSARGIRRVKGKAFTRPNVRGALKLPAGKNGPGFLMTKNFFVLKRYNNADKYALAVGHLADQIAGYGDFAKQLPRPYRKLSTDERFALQNRLAQMGLYDGEIDGKIGSGTRAAIRKAQDRLGMRQDGYESPKLLQRLNING